MALSSPIYDSIMSQVKKEGSTNYMNMASNFNKKAKASLDVFQPKEEANSTSSLINGSIDGSRSSKALPRSNTGLIDSIKAFGSPEYSQDKRDQPGFEDCSSGVCKVMKSAYNKDVGNTTLEQRKKGSWIKDPSVGDLVHFNTGEDSRHVGIMIGDGTFWHQSTSGPKVTNIKDYGFKPIGYTRH